MGSPPPDIISLFGLVRASVSLNFNISRNMSPLKSAAVPWRRANKQHFSPWFTARVSLLVTLKD